MTRQEAIENYRQSGISLYRTQKTYTIHSSLNQSFRNVADWIDVCKENLAIGLYTAMNPDF